MAVAGLDSSRARLSPTRSIQSWSTPPDTPPSYTPLIQVDWHGEPPSASSTPALARRSSWYTQKGHDWSPKSVTPTSSLLQIPPAYSSQYLQQRGSAHSLVEAVSVNFIAWSSVTWRIILCLCSSNPISFQLIWSFLGKKVGKRHL